MSQKNYKSMCKNFIIILILLLGSCASKKAYVTSVPKEEITEMAYFKPIARFYKIEKKGKNKQLALNISKSKLAEKRIEYILKSKKKLFHLSNKINISNDSIQNIINTEIENILVKLKNNKDPSVFKVPKEIKTVLENNKSRFGLVLIANHIDKPIDYVGVIAGALIAGAVGAIIVSDSSNVGLNYTGLIFDIAKNEVIFYKITKPQHINLKYLDDYLERELKRLFLDYFYFYKD